MDVTIDEVRRYHAACGDFTHQSANTQIFASLAGFCGLATYHFGVPIMAVLGILSLIFALYSGYKQYRARKIVRLLDARVHMFIRFYNDVGAGKRSLDEVVSR